MLQTAAAFVFRLAPSLKRNLWRSWYQDLARRFDFGDWVFMNYGFAAVGSPARPRRPGEVRRARWGRRGTRPAPGGGRGGDLNRGEPGEKGEEGGEEFVHAGDDDALDGGVRQHLRDLREEAGEHHGEARAGLLHDERHVLTPVDPVDLH